MSCVWLFPVNASSSVLSVHRGVDVLPDRFPGVDMSTDASDEEKKDRSKNKQLKSQVSPAVRQVHVVLWDEPPKGDPQEDDTDLEPDHV
jgi:hypothetical protein